VLIASGLPSRPASAHAILGTPASALNTAPRWQQNGWVGPWWTWEFFSILFHMAGWWFGTMEFYDIPYIWNVIIPTDEHGDENTGG
jgi:hypothetical protein